jgi:phosphohistidine phosphatase SixA
MSVIGLAGAALLVLLAWPAAAEALAGEALVEALRGGGYNIYFRHAATDWSQNDRVEEAGETGRATARRVGDAIRALKIPVGKVLSSEYCRAAETARLMDLGLVETTRDIMNLRAMEHVGGREAVIRRARRILSGPPSPGTNVVIVGHGNLMRAATNAYAGEGGSGIYAPRPGSNEGFELVAELSAGDWTRLAERFAGKD